MGLGHVLNKLPEDVSIVEIACATIYEARPQSKFLTRPTASKPYIARSDSIYVIEQ
jgi:hypothetical protein